MAREKRYTAPVRTRVTETVRAALHKAAQRRKIGIGSLVREMIEVSLGAQISVPSPIVRHRRPIENAELLADAVRLLGSVAGNLQRLYTMALEAHRIDDRELLALKTAVAKASCQLREAIGGGEDP